MTERDDNILQQACSGIPHYWDEKLPDSGSFLYFLKDRPAPRAYLRFLEESRHDIREKYLFLLKTKRDLDMRNRDALQLFPFLSAEPLLDHLLIYHDHLEKSLAEINDEFYSGKFDTISKELSSECLEDIADDTVLYNEIVMHILSAIVGGTIVAADRNSYMSDLYFICRKIGAGHSGQNVSKIDYILDIVVGKGLMRYRYERCSECGHKLMKNLQLCLKCKMTG